ncbi:MAG: aminotransferase class IV [Terriglobia bacterium]
MIDPLIVHNNAILPVEDVRLSPAQAGLLLGWGVFTTLRLYSGVPFEFGRHWQRMARDAKRLNIPLDVEMATGLRLMTDLARANQRSEGMARLSLVRNTGGAWGMPASRPAVDLLIFTQQLVSWPESYRLQLQPHAVFSAGALAGAKMLSWAANSAIFERARAEGYDDALLLNERGQLAECTSANVFLVIDGKALTPPLSSGCLPGVTREILLKIGPESGIQIAEEELDATALDRAQEVFISSTTREVGGVREIAGRWTYSTAGEVTRVLKEVFRRYVDSTAGRGAGN